MMKGIDATGSQEWGHLVEAGTLAGLPDGSMTYAKDGAGTRKAAQHIILCSGGDSHLLFTHLLAGQPLLIPVFL